MSMYDAKVPKQLCNTRSIYSFFADFNLDGKADNISFMIKRIKVHSAKDPTYRFPGNYGVEKFLEIFSGKCLLFTFTKYLVDLFTN